MYLYVACITGNKTDLEEIVERNLCLGSRCCWECICRLDQSRQVYLNNVASRAGSGKGRLEKDNCESLTTGWTRLATGGLKECAWERIRTCVRRKVDHTVMDQTWSYSRLYFANWFKFGTRYVKTFRSARRSKVVRAKCCRLVEDESRGYPARSMPRYLTSRQTLDTSREDSVSISVHRRLVIAKEASPALPTMLIRIWNVVYTAKIAGPRRVWGTPPTSAILSWRKMIADDRSVPEREPTLTGMRIGRFKSICMSPGFSRCVLICLFHSIPFFCAIFDNSWSPMTPFGGNLLWSKYPYKTYYPPHTRTYVGRAWHRIGLGSFPSISRSVSYLYQSSEAVAPTISLTCAHYNHFVSSLLWYITRVARRCNTAICGWRGTVTAATVIGLSVAVALQRNKSPTLQSGITENWHRFVCSQLAHFNLESCRMWDFYRDIC